MNIIRPLSQYRYRYQRLASIARGLLPCVAAAMLAGCAATGVDSPGPDSTPAQPTDASAGMTAASKPMNLDYAGAQGLALSKSKGTTGIASYYGSRFAGRRTANGERFNPRKLTAAHRTLPFGTRVLVTNLSNNEHVTVRINDRGPFIDSRIIDLSRGAARRIGMLAQGTAQVRLRVLDY